MATTSQHPETRRIGNGASPSRPGAAKRLLAVLVALVLIATACGQSEDSATEEAGETTEEASEAFDDRGTDAEESFVETDDFAEEEAMEEEASGDDGLVGNPSTGDAEQALVEDFETEREGDLDDGTDEVDDGTDEVDDGNGLFGTIDPEDIDEEEPPTTSSETDPRFTDYGIRTFIDTAADSLSTFSLDVDTGSYSIGRSYLNNGDLPPRESVRVEEYVNFFDFDYDAPRSGLDAQVDGGPSPFDDDTYLVRVGVQSAIIEDGERQPVALTFVVDTSGSMSADNRLGLVKESLSLLVDELERDDTVAIVTYSGDSDIILDPTPIRDRDEILDAIDDLDTGGSTNLQAGLDTGYDLAREAFRDDGVNRVIVASDGLANAGITNADDLSARLRRDADDGIGLVTVGYGLGGGNDTTMEQLADQSDGFYAYVDTIAEAERLFSEDLTATLITAAIDSKVQVEFDEDVVSEYRLIGYENRAVADSDFRNDEVDAGELGAGHQATAIYEVRLARGVSIEDRAELGVVSLRWEDPDTGEVIEIDEDIDMSDIDPSWTSTSTSFQQAVVVAAFAEVLRDNPYADDVDLDALHEEADSLAREIDTDEFDEFAELVEIALEVS